MKTKLVAIANHTLGYILPERPDQILVLHSSILKGGVSDRTTVLYAVDYNYRLVSRKDFDDLRVSFEGYENDPDNYEFAE